MPTIVDSLYTVLQTNSTLTDLLRSTKSIYPHVLPESHPGYPAVTYALVQEEDIPLLNGTRADLRRATVEVRVWDDNYSKVMEIAEVVKTALIGVTGTFGTHVADFIRKDESGEVTLPPEPGTKLYSSRLRFDLNYHS